MSKHKARNQSDWAGEKPIRECEICKSSAGFFLWWSPQLVLIYPEGEGRKGWADCMHLQTHKETVSQNWFWIYPDAPKGTVYQIVRDSYWIDYKMVPVFARYLIRTRLALIGPFLGCLIPIGHGDKARSTFRLIGWGEMPDIYEYLLELNFFIWHFREGILYFRIPVRKYPRKGWGVDPGLVSYLCRHRILGVQRGQLSYYIGTVLYEVHPEMDFFDLNLTKDLSLFFCSMLF
jgi:hypothetical protein